MVTWSKALDHAAAGQPASLELRPRRLLLRQRSPVVIAGASGAGKTRLWSRLTLRSQPRGPSLTTDDGYMMHPNKSAFAMMTIPGEQSRARHFALDEIFGIRTRANGVIFVASYGYAQIWPSNTDIVANSLPSFDLDSLREWNLSKELDGFKEVCDRLVYKHLSAPEGLAPGWLMVAVNKMDLYWDERHDAGEYYRHGGTGPFAAIVDDVMARLGTARLKYAVIPVSTESQEYEFHAARGSISSPSLLSSAACDASLVPFVETLEGLDGK